jgi:hypothetical protein
VIDKGIDIRRRYWRKPIPEPERPSAEGLIWLMVGGADPLLRHDGLHGTR